MNRHVASNPDIDTRLTVPATAGCHARSVLLVADGRPGLVIDYGGYELAFEMRDPQVGEQFAVSLAFAALCFASNCHGMAAVLRPPAEEGEI